MVHTRRTLLVAMVVLVIPVAVGAVTIHVPSVQPTIQQGIDAASGGDTVLVAAGTYTGALNRDLDFGGTNIAVISEGGPMAVIIDCESSGRGFFFHSGEDTTSLVHGFTIRNAVADTGAGAYCKNGSSPRFEVCAFEYCVAQMRGGGLCCDGSSPVVRYCVFSQNVANNGIPTDGRGGGMSCMSGSSPLIADTEFIENETWYAGGGFYSRLSTPRLVRCEFLGNLIDDYGHGAGAGILQSDGATLTECIFRENGFFNCQGGGLYVASATITVTDCIFVDNSAGYSGGIFMVGTSTSAISGCTFIGNSGGYGTAGGLWCLTGANPTVTNCTFVANRNQHMWFQDASPTLEYCILAFAANGPAVLCNTGTETPSISHCFVFGNAGGDSLCGGNYHDNEYADPLLCDWELEDVTLCADSPCLPGVTWASLVGAEDEGCPACGTPAEHSTWGAIKRMYR